MLTITSFLDGVRLGSSKDWNTQLSIDRMRKMQRKARLFGLEDTAQVLCNEMSAAQIQLRGHEDRHKRLLQGEAGAQRGLVRQAQRPLSQVDLAEQDRESEYDFDEVFEMDEDGRIV